MAKRESCVIVGRTEVFVDVYGFTGAILDRSQNKLTRSLEECWEHCRGSHLVLVAPERGDAQSLNVVSAEALIFRQLTINCLGEFDRGDEFAGAFLIAF